MSDLDIPASLNQYAPDQMRVVKIKIRAHSPEDAASIANNVAHAFADYRKERSRNAVKNALDMVKSAAKKSKDQLDKIDAQFKKLKADNNIIDVQANATEKTAELNRLRERKSLKETVRLEFLRLSRLRQKRSMPLSDSNIKTILLWSSMQRKN